METHRNVQNKSKAREVVGGAQVLQVVPGAPLASASTVALLGASRPLGLVIDPPRCSTSSDTSSGELSPAFLGAQEESDQAPPALTPMAAEVQIRQCSSNWGSSHFNALLDWSICRKGFRISNTR
ncbi:UNVERIFIED_CONTAM: hypothetical protein Sangu_2868200 [Sesamum angustifolium]|uniref:Uncharacterized protein n=1 Tax=Sesamum angustifolium TaxID=2727405 RepID=A0AAW2IQ35_9LAMI